MMKKSTSRKLISILLFVTMLFTLYTNSVFASNNETVELKTRPMSEEKISKV